ENLGDVYAKLASQAYDKALQIDSSNKGAQNKLSLVRELVGGATVAPVAMAQKSPDRPAAAAQKAPEKPAEAPKPAPQAAVKPAPEKPAAAEAGADVLAAVKGWAQAWSKKDADAYLAHAKDFKTPGGQPRAEWEKNRRSRIAAP